MTETLDTPENNDIETEAERPLNVVDIKTKSILAEGVAADELVPLVEHPRWPDAKIPAGYRLSNNGVHRLLEAGPGERFCGPIYVLAQTLTPSGGDAGLVLEFEDRDAKFKTLVIPRTRLYEDAKLLSSDLGQLNFFLCPGKEKDLLVFLSKIVTPKTDVACPQTGWVEGGASDKLNFVFPTHATAEDFHFQPERYSPAIESVRPNGSLKDWCQNVYSPEPYILFSILVSLSGAIIRAAGIDSGGFNLWGDSTSGKTTAAQAAASVWGNGSDPATDGNSYIRRWNMTRNGSESICASSRDMCGIFDELHCVNSKDAGSIVYDMAGGQGKAVQDTSKNLRKIKHWRMSILSTGEVSMQSKIEEGFAGKKTPAKAGQMVRIIDIHVKKGVITKSAAHSDQLKRNCSKFYGSLGPAFIDAVVAKWSSEAFQDVVQSNLDKCLTRILSTRGEVTAIQQRALRRFALAEVAGLLLVYLKLVPGLSKPIVQSAIDRVIDDWMPSAVHLSDAARAINSLRDFILKNRELRFKPYKQAIAEKDKLHREIAGYYDSSRDIFYILPESFKEAAQAEPGIVAAALKEDKLLVCDQEGRLTHRISVEHQRITTYAVRGSLLGESVGYIPEGVE